MTITSSHTLDISKGRKAAECRQPATRLTLTGFLRGHLILVDVNLYHTLFGPSVKAIRSENGFQNNRKVTYVKAGARYYVI